MRGDYTEGAHVIWRRETGERVFATVVRMRRVGDRIRILIRHPDGEQYVWASALEPDPSQPVRLVRARKS